MGKNCNFSADLDKKQAPLVHASWNGSVFELIFFPPPLIFIFVPLPRWFLP